MHIFANFYEKSDAECRHENEELKRTEIPFKELNQTEIRIFFLLGMQIFSVPILILIVLSKEQLSIEMLTGSRIMKLEIYC